MNIRRRKLTITADDCQAAPSGASLTVTSSALPAGAQYLGLRLGDGSVTAFDDGAGGTITAEAAIGSFTTTAIEVDAGNPATLPVAPSTAPLSGQNSGIGGEALSLTLSVSAPAQVTGTGDTTTAGWYGGGGTLDGASFSLAAGFGMPATVTLSAPADAADLLSQVNGTPSFAFRAIATIVANHLVITGFGAGAAAFVLSAGDPDALTVLGLAEDTYTSTDGDVNDVITGAISAEVLFV